MRRRASRAAALVLTVVSGLPFAVLACGGGEQAKPPATPEPEVVSAAPPPTSKPVVHADVSAAAKGAYARGFAAFQAGDLAGAKQAFLDASRADPQAPAPLTGLGVVLEHMGDTSGAQQQYQAALAVKSDDTAAMSAYAMSLCATGRAAQADTFVTNQMTKHPNSAPITTILSEVKSAEGDTASAQQLAQDALRLDPDYKPAMVAIAHDHYRAHRTELAQYALQALLDGAEDGTPARDKNNGDARLIRALIEEQAGYRALAMADFDAARTARPDSVEALIHLGVMKLQAGNVQEATPVLESAVKFAPKAPLAHLNLADAYRLGGRVADAKREFDLALAMDSSLAVAHYDMGLLYLFSASVPGTTALDQVGTAIRELETYRTMRGPKSGTDDVDELLTSAQAKQADLKIAPPAPTPAPTPTPAKPAASAPPPAAPSAKPAAPTPSAKPAGQGPASPAPSGSAKPAPPLQQWN